MNCRGFAGLAVTLFAALPVFASPSNDDKRQFTVRDSIGLKRLKDPDFESGGMPHFKQSPDGRWFLTIEQTGDLDSNTVRSKVRLFAVPDDLPVKPVEGRVVYEATSATNYPAVSQPRWIDSGTIAFLAVTDGAVALHRLDINAGRAILLARFADDIVDYDVTPRGDIACLLYKYQDPAVTERRRREGYVITEESMTQADRQAVRSTDPIPLMAPGGFEYRLHYRAAGESQPWKVWDLGPLPGPSAPKISPDGRFVLHFSEDRKAVTPVPQAFPALILMMRDTATGIMQPATAGAMNPMARFVWSSDSSRIILIGGWMPGTGATSDPGLASYSWDLTTRKANLITKHDDPRVEIDDLRWNGRDTLQLAQSRFLEPLPWSEFKFDGRRWHSSRPLREIGSQWTLLRDGRLGLRIAQDSNRSAYVEISRFSDGRRARFAAIEPRLEDFAFARAEHREWTDPDGDTMPFGLIYPVDYVLGRRYPLVIQTHGYDPREFLVTGPFGFQTAFAARALSAAGFFIVQMHLPGNTQRWFYSSREAVKPMQAMAHIVDALSREGLVDPDKVAAIGFSRTCYHVKYAMAHASFKLAAAVVADGIDFGYMQFLGGGVTSAEYRNDFATRYDGKLPIGEGLRTWLKLAPTFNAHKIHTPMLSQAITGRASGEWEMYQTLRLAGVPAEMIHFPDGEHDLFKPQEQLRSQSATVDWIRFWLQDYEDPAETKREQYARWREMKSAWRN